MAGGLHAQPHPATPAVVTPRGKVVRSATIPWVNVMAVPRAAWPCTDPDLLDEAARTLSEAAVWLRAQLAEQAVVAGVEEVALPFDGPPVS